MKILFKLHDDINDMGNKQSYKLIITDVAFKILKIMDSDPRFIEYDVLITKFTDKYETIYPQWTNIMSEIDQLNVDNLLLKNNIAFKIEYEGI